MLEEQRAPRASSASTPVRRRRRGRGRRPSEARRGGARPSREPVAHTPLDLAADARYHATGKRKSAVARVILKPGEGTYTRQRPPPRRVLPARHASSAWRASRSRRPATRTRMDVVARIHGGGVSAQADGSAPRHRPRAGRGRPGAARRAQAPRLPHARPAREGAQEGRPQEGPQAAAVLQALAVMATSSTGAAPEAVRHRRRPRRRGRVPDRRARPGAGPRRGARSRRPKRPRS